MLSRVLPFDDEEDKEIARQTIQDAPDFTFEPWDTVSDDAKDLVKKLLEKKGLLLRRLSNTLGLLNTLTSKKLDSTSVNLLKIQIKNKKQI